MTIRHISTESRSGSRHSRRGEPHFSGTATIAKPQSGESADLPYRKTLIAAALICVAAAGPPPADKHDVATKQCVAAARQVDPYFQAFFDVDGWTMLSSNDRGESRFRECLISKGFHLESEVRL